jgi:uncharacterized Zn-finger protein
MAFSSQPELPPMLSERQFEESSPPLLCLHFNSIPALMLKRSRPNERQDALSSILATPKHPKMSIDYLLNNGSHSTSSLRPNESSPYSGPWKAPKISELASVRAVHLSLDETSSEVSAEQLPSKPYHCDLCSKSFKEQGNLTKHKRSVHAPRSSLFQCNVGNCNKRFSFRDGLNRHTATVHEGIRPYRCPVAGCDKRFKQRSHSGKHVRTVHKGFVPECSDSD